MWLKNRRIQSLGGGSMERFGLRWWSRLQFSALRSRKSPEIVSLLRDIHRQKRTLMSAYESYIIYSVSRAQSRLDGAFVHFDVDLYEGTKACLEYFYPRMTPGGIMLSHDYDILAGVSQAFHEFLADKPETLIEQPTTQCMVVKR